MVNISGRKRKLNTWYRYCSARINGLCDGLRREDEQYYGEQFSSLIEELRTKILAELHILYQEYKSKLNDEELILPDITLQPL